MSEGLGSLASPCRLCPRSCRAERSSGKLGTCGMGFGPVVSSAGPHFGEESVLVGRGGSGTIFLAGCNLLCLFCQNRDISHGRRGKECTVDDLAAAMMGVERMGCENVNFVTPTHFAHAIASGIRIARERGLRVPVVYNCGGYESVEALKLLDGLVEIYMPDMKTLDADFARRAMSAPDYPDRAKAALTEMHRQVGDLVVEDGVAARGLLVRHLVMPGMVEDSAAVLGFLKELSPDTFVNVMGQYRPCHRADELDGLSRRPTREEVARARDCALSLGLRRSD